MKLKDAIIPIFQDDKKGIGIDLYECKNVGNIKKINLPNLKWRDYPVTVVEEETGKEKTIDFIEIVNIPNNLISEIVETIKNIIEKDNNISIAQAIEQIINYFKKVKFVKEIKKKLLGDIGEALFILDSLNNGIDVISTMRECDNDIYDFQVNDKFLEVKSSSIEKNEFTITHEQLNQVKDKFIIISKFKIIQGHTTILDLYNMIENKYGSLNSLLSYKKEYWLHINESCISEENKSDIINDYSINLENYKLYQFKEENLPIVEIKDFKSCKSIEYKINCTDSELLPIDNFYNWFKTKNNKF